jgi:cell division GTPase FtsZ
MEGAAALLRQVLEKVDSTEVAVGRLPGEMATRRRMEGAAAVLEALAERSAPQVHQGGANADETAPRDGAR